MELKQIFLKSLLALGLLGLSAPNTQALTPVPNQFSNGTAANAAEVNENFDHLTQGINSLEGTISQPIGRVVTVGKTGGDVQTMQQAFFLANSRCGIPNADSPCLVLVGPGTFALPSSTPNIPYLTVQGAGPQLTKLTGNNNDYTQGVLDIGNKMTLKNLTLRNQGTGSAVRNSGSSQATGGTLENVKIEFGSGYGLSTAWNASTRLINVEFTGNQGAVILGSSGEFTAQGLRITQTSSSRDAIEITSAQTGAVYLDGFDINLSSSSSRAALKVNSADVVLKNGRIQVAGTYPVYGILNYGQRLKVQGVNILAASRGVVNYGSLWFMDSKSSNCIRNHTSNAADFQVVNSQIFCLESGFGPARCLYSYNTQSKLQTLDRACTQIFD